jgi:UDP-N-acetylmuramate--alanine ligase
VGDGAGADCRVEPDRLIFADGREVELRLAVPGRHNRDNAACAVLLADWCGVAPEIAAARLAAFTGVGRRFELRGEAAGVRVVDDYAHHPVEIAATLAAAREDHDGRIVVIFQPHLYSRTKALLAEFAESLSAADLVVVCEIYAAREAYDPSVTAGDVATAIAPPARALVAADLDEALEVVEPELLPGDLVLTVGAGDITRLGQELVARLQKHAGDGGDPHGRGAP